MDTQLNAFRSVLPYLNSDRDRLNLITCCKAFRVLLKYVRFVRMYNYNKVKHSGYIKVMCSIYHTPIAPKANYAYSNAATYTSFISPSNYITTLITYSGIIFGLRSFPSQLYWLEINGKWHSDYRLPEILPKTLRVLIVSDSIHECDIPTTIHTLMVGWVDGMVPPNVTSLTIFRPDKPMNYIGTGVTYLHIKSCYTTTNLNIPENVTHLVLDTFIQPNIYINIPGVTFLINRRSCSIDLRTFPNKVANIIDYNENIHPGPSAVYLMRGDNVYTDAQIDQFR